MTLKLEIRERLPAGAEEFRRAALARFEAEPFPLRTDEEWRRTDLSRFDFSNFPPAGASVEVPEGAHVAPLVEHPELVPRLSTSDRRSERKFSALADAFFGPGACVRIPRGVRLDDPLRITTTVPAEATSFPRTLVVAEEGARILVVEEVLGSGDGRSLCISHVDLVADAGASIRYFRVQKLTRETVHLETLFADAGRDASIESVFVETGGLVTKKTADFRLDQPGGRVSIRGAVVGRGRQHFDAAVNVFHTAPHASSDVYIKTALKESARSVFTGTIRVAKAAQKTDSYEKNLNLLLSKRARADAIPRLEIEADDVKCGHGAAVGTVEDEPLFYLMSRGLDRAEAEKLIVEGFFEEIFGKLDLPPPAEWIRHKLRQAALAHLEGEHEG
jgi:Fe-S cluster assembly protein SufD